ncbi:MAG TPA: L,D-transpeptidase family protein [Acidimicrobiales bacterium]|nr:L,D-transpeptidase family protein [Acidimicrobiales bacterium]
MVTSVVAAVLALSLAACGSGGTRPASRRSSAHPVARHDARRAASTTTSAPTTTTTTTSAPTTSTAPPAASSPPTTSAPPPASPLPFSARAVGSSQQVMTVVAGSYGETVATFSVYQLTSAGWQQKFGPWQADIGQDGFAPPGAKHEGDGRTPSGSYGFTFFFGDLSEPAGYRFPFRQATASDFWDDDPSSPDYNQWVDESTQGAGAAGANPEPMYDEPAYDYGAVIAYNMDPVTPGAGSAIFLHVSTGGPTAGCVSLPTSELLDVLNWMDPSEQPLIVMGTPATVAAG